jgi:hypothetical protein
MPLILAGATSGQATVQATDAQTVTLTLPATSGTLAVGGTTPSFSTLTVTGNTNLATSSGSVGIGTSSPVVGRALTLNSASNYFGLVLQTSGTTRGQIIQESTGNIYVDAGSDGGSGALIFRTNGIERGQFDSSGNFKFNSGYGSVATAYGCRAWVNFDGTGTVAIRASGNVSSITDIDTGSYGVNLATAMPDANYSAVGSQSDDSMANAGVEVTPSTSSSILVKTKNFSNNTRVDALKVSIAVFR